MNKHPRLFQAISEDDGCLTALFVCFESPEEFSDEEVEEIIEEEFEKNLDDLDTVERCLKSRINIERTYVIEVNVKG